MEIYIISDMYNMYCIVSWPWQNCEPTWYLSMEHH